ncbi:hypothetical protein V6R21_15845 [Limibacter armeniacum]|uniref:hypothetical protein n=1 Tax=Limibacter armeniacum TaxID=466084 RepID=UPI002FE6204B
MEFYFYFLTFLFSFIISTIQFGEENIGKDYSYLYGESASFWAYGIIHGLLSVLVLVFLVEKNILSSPNLLDKFIYAAALGLSLKGFANISFFNKQVNNDQTISFGPKLIMDYLDNYLGSRIIELHDDIILKRIATALTTNLTKYDQAELNEILAEYIPKSNKLQKESFKLELENATKIDSLRFFINQYGMKRFDIMIKNIKDDSPLIREILKR